VWRHRLFWPLVTLALLLAVNAAFNASFLRLEWREGHLYGSLVDIVKSAAPLALVALGMTLVIATRGIDISVGAVVAISAAVAAWMIGGSLVIHDGVATHVSRFPMWAAHRLRPGVALLCGAWNGALVAFVGMQPIVATLILMVAGRGVAQLVTNGQIITVYYGRTSRSATATAGPAGAVLHRGGGVRGAAAGGAAHGAGPVHPGRRHQSLGGAPGGPAGAAHHLLGLCLLRLCAGVAGLIVSSTVKSADGNNAGMLMELDAILAVTWAARR
jgi:ribose/xylose/arabinose/galactoside ABC-type transport system permease subunit